MDWLNCNKCKKIREQYPYSKETKQLIEKQEIEWQAYLIEIASRDHAVVFAIYAGEHYNVTDIMDHMAQWMTGHLKDRTDPLEFHHIWEEFEESGWEPSDTVPGLTGDTYWIDAASFEYEFPDELYFRAVSGHADKIIATSGDYVYLAAVKGDYTKDDVQAWLTHQRYSNDIWRK